MSGSFGRESGKALGQQLGVCVRLCQVLGLGLGLILILGVKRKRKAIRFLGEGRTRLSGRRWV